MSTKRILTATQAASISAAATTLLVTTCGEKWKENFLKAQADHSGKTKTIKFELPVLARIVMDDIYDPKSGKVIGEEKKITKMIMKKIHDKNIEHVHTLLKSYLSSNQIKAYWTSISQGIECTKTKSTFEKMLISA